MLDPKKLQEWRKKKGGFTLVEIIAVLVILAVLAAVAVPKYFDLADDAKEKAVEGALAEGMSVCSLAYARLAACRTLRFAQIPTGC